MSTDYITERALIEISRLQRAKLIEIYGVKK